MRIIGVIPSRYGSSRFPGKPLAVLAGKPLVTWVVEAAERASLLDEVIVATDDERIRDAVVQHGGKAVMTPSELPSGTDRVACAAGDFADDDIIVNIQGDEPLIDPALIDALASRLAGDAKWDMATAVTPIRNERDLRAKTVVKVVLDRDDGALYFSRATIPACRDNPEDFTTGMYVRHLGIYARSRATSRRPRSSSSSVRCGWAAGSRSSAPRTKESASTRRRTRSAWRRCSRRARDPTES